MTIEMTIAGMIAGLVVGAAGAGWRVAHGLNRKFDQKLRQITDTHRKQHEAVVDKLNASHALAKKELDHQRSSMPRQLAVASADQRSTVARLEEQLRAAYVELDLLRLEVRGPAPVGQPRPPSGFADTQPFVPQQKSARR